MARLYELKYPAGTYTDKDGAEKTRWLSCGSFIETGNGKKKVRLDAIPTEFNGWLEAFEPRQPHEQAAAASAKQQPADDFDDDVPF